MRACTITSKRIFLLLALLTLPATALAQGNPNTSINSIPNAMIPSGNGGPGGVPNASPSGPGGANDPNAPAIPSGAKKEEPNLFDQSSPYLDYGDFNMNEEENEDALFFQYGRFFGVSLGLGYQTATGNRGKLYQAGFPRLDLRIQYWFTFNFALDMGVFFVNQDYTDTSNNLNTVKMIGYGMHLKYYIDVRDASAALTFANPFISVGVGAISKSESTSQTTTASSDSTLSVDLGGGLEFPVVYKKTYFILEGMYHTQNFTDSTTTEFQSKKIDDLSGGFLTLMGYFMFVW